MVHICITVTSQWALWRLKSPTSRLFTSKKTSNSASLAFVGWIHRWPVDSPHKGPVTLKMFPFDDVIMRITEYAFTIYVITSAIASQITSVSIVYSTVCSDTVQRKHPSSAPLALVRRIHRWPVDSPRKGPVTRKMFPLDDVNSKYFMFLAVVYMYNNFAQFSPMGYLWKCF